MDAFLVSTGVVALAEIGDKTQLLALVLAARYRAPLPIIAGILVATVLNHALASVVGVWLTEVLGPQVLRWILGVSFVAMGVWTVIPDTLAAERRYAERLGVFGATLAAFFLMEMGDKTQLATVALAARYRAPGAVLAGTTLGMMLANVPSVLVGDAAATRLPVRLIHVIASVILIALGVLALVEGRPL